MKRTAFTLMAVALLVGGVVTVARAGGSAANYAVTPDILASGGQAASSANYAMVSTVSQPAIGQGSSTNYSACSGVWCEITSLLSKLFLPLVMK